LGKAGPANHRICCPILPSWLSASLRERPMLETDETIVPEKRARPIVENEKSGYSSTGNPFDSSTSSPDDRINGKEVMESPANEKQTPASPRGRNRRPAIYLNKFRIPIYVQLCVVICILCGLCVMVVAVTTVHHPCHPLTCSMSMTEARCWMSKERTW
jgi:hypothetical protein